MTHNELFLKATNLLQDQIILEESPNQEPVRPKVDAAKVNEAIGLLEEVVKINPNNWAAYWTMGKAYQTLNDSQKQYEAFKKSQAIARVKQPNNYADVLRELVLACLKLDKIKEAVYYARQALEFSPTDFTLMSNYASTLMMDGQYEEAEKYAHKALAIEDDLVAKNILSLIAKVKAGELKISRFVDIEAIEAEKL